jgi:hypothetical protein
MSHSFSQTKLSAEQATLPQDHFFAKLPISAAAVGFVSLLVAFFLGKMNPDYFFFSFHTWWLFFLSIAIGSIFFVLIQFAVKAGWSVIVRRFAENLGLTVPLFLVLFVVMIFGSQTLYHHWLSPESFSDEVINSKRWYLNLPFFYSRSIFYLVMFSIAGIYFAKYSRRQDDTGDHALTYKLQHASYPFLIILGFCITFAAFDWIMSLEPHWYSTIFGLYFFASCYVVCLAVLAVITRLVHNIPAFENVITTDHYHDLGKLVFGHSCFWAYAAFCQYLLIWYGNLPEETVWYEVRQSHGWAWIWWLLCIGHFLVPFLFLMARRAKRSRDMVFAISVWIIVMHFVDIYWLIVPSKYHDGPHLGWIDLFCFLGIGGLFVALFTAITKRKLLVPIQDPRLNESLTYENQ